MSNHLAIATVTATLRQMLQDAVEPDVSGISVDIVPPNDPKLKDSQPGLNLYLYHVALNPTWRNADLPTRREDGSLVARPRLAVDLHYLLTAYGKATANDPEAQRVLGSAVRVLHERPVLTRAQIRAVVLSHLALGGSDLADQVELVRITPETLSLEELSKLWSVFFQTPYRISMAYVASVVLIESRQTPQPALPVRARNLYVVALKQPVVESVTAQAGVAGMIVAGDTLVIGGAGLRGEITRVRVGEVEVAPVDGAVTDTAITLPLPAGVRAGVSGVQVVHRRLLGTPEVEHAGAESNVAPFVLHPAVRKNAAGTAYLVGVAVSGGAGTAPRAGQITVTLDPEVARQQRVVLLLNEANPPASRPARAYSFEAPSRAAAPDPATDTLTIPFAGVAAGAYLVRVQVDGAQSPLDVDAGGLYSAPAATVP